MAHAPSTRFQEGDKLAETMLLALAKEATRHRTLPETSLMLAQTVILPTTEEERHRLWEGFFSRITANSGLRHAPKVTWTFTVAAEAHTPSERPPATTAVKGSFHVWFHPVESLSPQPVK